MKTELEILYDHLDIARRISENLRRSLDSVGKDIPLASKEISGLSNEQVDRIDLFLSRFGRLQDFMTTKLFRSLARASLEDMSGDVSLIDTIGRMEKFGIIPSVEEWVTIRQLRNSVTHEYLTDNRQIAENINLACAKTEILLGALKETQAYTDTHLTGVV